MKKIYLLGLTLAFFTIGNAQTTIIDDDFESYDLGSYYGGHWDNWTLNDDPDLNIIISDSQAVSGTKSGYIGPHNESNGQDVLLVMPETYENGKVTTVWKMFIPTGKVAYYNIQEDAVPGTAFGVQCYINYFNGANDTLADGSSMANKFAWLFSMGESTYLWGHAPVIFDEWFTIKHVMDLDAKTLNIYINDDQEITYYLTDFQNSWPGEVGKFGSFDFYSMDDSADATVINTYYIDDVNVLREEPSSIGEIVKNSNLVSVYPNPSNNYINIAVKDEMIQKVEVFNLAGQKVLTSKENAATVSLNVQGLAAGVYSAKVTTKDKTYAKEFVVK